MRLVYVVLVLGFVLFGAAGAQAKDGARVQFVEFPNLVIKGDIKAPAVTFDSARDRVKFERLMRLEKRFLEPFDENGPAGREPGLK